MEIQQEDQVESFDICGPEQTPEPCTIIIFGASGDLTFRKLTPALYNLFINDKISEKCCILGVGRTEMSDDSFRKKMKAGVNKAGLDLQRWGEFGKNLYYQQISYDAPASYKSISSRLLDIEGRHQTAGNRIFSLALPPILYATVARALGEAGLSKEGRGTKPWTRLIVEKPFGYDLDSARRLDMAISKSFKEHQVFRIDHYMAKETVQNILIFRFANAIFEPLWNRNYIDYVRINASETLGVEDRSQYYEKSGVLRDMFQNHMMELLALVAAEPPSMFSADRVRDKKAELFCSLRPFDLKTVDDHLVLGQYEAGQIGGKRAPGYRKEPGVDPASLTPTYALMKIFVDNWRWQGVPFYVTSGKRLKRKVTRIDIQFKSVPHSMFRHILGQTINANRLVMGIYPHETIFLNFQAMRPSTRFCLRTAGLHFSFYKGEKGAKLNAYEKALAETMAGDQTLFWRQDELELCWEFFDPVLLCSEPSKDCSLALHPYSAGSQGPEKALDMLPPGSWPEKP